MLLVGASAAVVPARLFAQDETSAFFFSAQRLAVLDQIAAIVIPRTDTPGAHEVGVPAMLDALIANWASPATGEELRSVLDDVDLFARAEQGATLARLAPDRRAEAVAAYDIARIGTADAPWLKLKELILLAYYCSEAGATQELRYELVPGVWEASMPLGDDRRAWAV